MGGMEEFQLINVDVISATRIYPGEMYPYRIRSQFCLHYNVQILKTVYYSLKYMILFRR